MIGQLIFAQRKDQSGDVKQFIITREWPNALEVVPGYPGIQSYKPMRLEQDGPGAWDVLGRGRCVELVTKMIQWLRHEHQGASVEWDAGVKCHFEWTADLLQDCLGVSNLVGAKVIAVQPYGPGRDEFVVLSQHPHGLMVVPTNVGAYGATRFLQTDGKYAWNVIETSPGINELRCLICTLTGIDGTEKVRADLTAYLERMLGQ